MSYSQNRHLQPDETPAWEPAPQHDYTSSAEAGSLGAASAVTPSAGAAAEADAHGAAAATGPDSDAAALSFSVSDVLLPDGEASATGMGFSFADAGDFSDTALAQFMTVAEDAIGDIKEGLEELLESGSHDQTGTASAEGFGHGDAEAGGATASADAHSAALTEGEAEAAAFSFSISEAEANGQDGLALASAFSFAGAGDFTEEELAEFMAIAQDAMGRIAEALEDLLDSNDRIFGEGFSAGPMQGFGGQSGGAGGGPAGGGIGQNTYDTGDYRAQDFGHLAHLLDADRSCWTFGG